jgi:hypothetical protein
MANYLYNGVELPVVPSGLNNYMAIYLRDGIYYLAHNGTPHVVVRNGEGVFLNRAHASTCDVLKLIDGEWIAVDASSDDDVPRGEFIPIWTNHDIKEYGTSIIKYKASQPVPAPDRTLDRSIFLTGWYMGQLIRSLRIHPEPPQYVATFVNSILYISAAPAKMTDNVLSLSAVDVATDAGGE